MIGQAQEHRVPLHFNFVDFKATFDAVSRKALLKMMIAIGKYPQNRPYTMRQSALVIDGQYTEKHAVKIGLRQGCLL